MISHVNKKPGKQKQIICATCSSTVDLNKKVVAEGYAKCVCGGSVRQFRPANRLRRGPAGKKGRHKTGYCKMAQGFWGAGWRSFFILIAKTVV